MYGLLMVLRLLHDLPRRGKLEGLVQRIEEVDRGHQCNTFPKVLGYLYPRVGPARLDAVNRFSRRKHGGDVEGQPVEPVDYVDGRTVVSIVDHFFEALDHQTDYILENRSMFCDRMLSEGTGKRSPVRQVRGFIRAHNTRWMILFFISSPESVLVDVAITVGIFPGLRINERELIGGQPVLHVHTARA